MRLKAKRGTIIAAVAVAAFVVYVVSQNRGVAPYNWPNIATFLVVGISLGGIYAISALGLVVTYSTTGIFNFAQGAIGCFLAFVYWELRVNRHWPAPLALFVVIFVMAPLLGVALDKLLMRRLRNAALVVQLMVTVGLMLAFMGLTLTIWKPDTGRSLNHFFESSSGVHFGQVVATWSPDHHRRAWPWSSPSACGPCSTAPASASPCAPSSTTGPSPGSTGPGPAWSAGRPGPSGAMTAAIAGILIAPETGMVVENLTLIIIIALAAAVIGQLKSLPWAFVGGMIVGLVKAFSSQFLAYSKDYSYANDAIPAIILLVAVLFLPQARLETGRPHLTRRTERLTKPWEAARRGPGDGRGGDGLGQRVDPVVLRHPLRPAHAGVARPGRRLHGHRADHAVPRPPDRLGRPGELRQLRHRRVRRGHVRPRRRPARTGASASIWVVLICAPLGVAIAVPVLRLKGLYVALATMAFAELADRILFRHPAVISQIKQGNFYQPLHLFGFRISSDAPDRKAFVIFLAITFALLFFLLEMLRRSRFARRWIAMADSPAASATVGMNLTTSKVLVFALSGAIAGFAGAMLGLSTGALSVDSFPLFAGLPLVLLLAVQGVRYPVAAFFGVLGLALFPALYEVTRQAQLPDLDRPHRPRSGRHLHGLQTRGGDLLRRAGPGRHPPVAARRPGGEGHRCRPRTGPSTSRRTRSATWA